MKAADFPGQTPVIVERGSARANSAEGVVHLLRGALAVLERGNRDAAEFLRRGGAIGKYDFTDRGIEVQVLADRIGYSAALCDLVGAARITPIVQHEEDDVDLPAWSAPSPESFGDATQYLVPVVSLLAAIAINRDAVTMLASSAGATRAAAIATLGELAWQADRVPRP